jgi:two-component system, OmpR family, sensor histidine kinase ChvG
MMADAYSGRRTGLRSRIAARLLAFNLLVLFLPIAAILYLDVYEARLLESLERGMGQQARLLAASMSAASPLDATTAATLLGDLGERADARLRIYDAAGTLLADSNRIAYPGERSAQPYAVAASGSRERLLYRLGAWMAGTRRVLVEWTDRHVLRRPEEPFVATETGAVPPELRAALAGHYGAATRPTPGQRSLTLIVAMPIRTAQGVVGAVTVSQSTFRVLQALYDVRLRIFEVVIGSMAAAMLLTALAAATVVRPITRLRDEATALAERRNPLPGEFPDRKRADEIGDLARALHELTGRLDGYVRELERFASDVSHEFKNPLASIRAAAETAAQSDNPGERQRFLSLLIRDVDRLERLVSGVRELTRIDAQRDQEPAVRVDVTTVLSDVVQGLRLAHGNQPEVRLTHEGLCSVRASRDRLSQAFENVIVNARSFAPSGTVVDVTVKADSGMCRVEIADRGPGIPEGHRDRIFDRFFTYRPDTADAERSEHAGLGLSIARTIIQSYGGTIVAANRDGGGARFEIRLPRDRS